MRNRPISPFLAVVFAVGGGLLTDTAFPDRNWWALVFVGVGLLYGAIERRGPWASWALGVLWGLSFFLPHINWADFAVGPVPWIALSLAQALLVGLGCAAWSWASRARVLARLPLLAPLVFALIWTAAEVLRSAWPFGGFPWGRLAFSQADSPLGRFAWLGGTTLVSLLVALVSALVGIAILRLLRFRLGVAGGALTAGFLVLATGLLVPLSAQAEDGFLRIGAVQGNVEEPGLGSFGQMYEVLGNHVDGTMALLDEVEPGDLDVILWPENASDLDPREYPRAAEMIDDAARALEAPILVGTQTYLETGGRLNEGALWQPGEGITHTYAKRHPAPFAEYVPMRDLARKFSSAVDLVTTDMLAGDTPGVFDIETPRHDDPVQIGDVICFEVAYDDVVRDSILEGGSILVVQTNNANFGFTPESTQQLAMARIRAIESGRATIQISTVGVSGVIEPNGVVTQRTELFTADTLIASMPIRTSLTPAVKIGSVPNGVVSVSAGLFVLLGVTATVASRRQARGTRDRVPAKVSGRSN